MSDEIPKAVWSGTFSVGGIEMQCHVLDNGQRLIDAESMERFVSAAGSVSVDTDGVAALSRWLRGQDA